MRVTFNARNLFLTTNSVIPNAEVYIIPATINDRVDGKRLRVLRRSGYEGDSS